MLTWIVTHSDTLCNFLIPLLVGFSPAQQRHALNLIEALLVSTAKHKTLAALTRLLRVPHADEYALADFLRVSPWPSLPVHRAITRFLLHTVAQIQIKTGWRLLFLSVDDALCRKDAETRALQAVDWHYDHVTVRRQKGKCTNASHYVTLHLQLGSVQFTLTWRLYLKRDQVKRLNRQRRQASLPALTFQTLPELVEEMLTEIAPGLPRGCRVYVLFDSWFDGHHLETFIRQQGWHWICATRSNRNLSGRPLASWWNHLGQQRITRWTVRSATRRHTYLTRHLVGRLRRYPEPVVAIISKWDRGDRHPRYFLCSDPHLSVRTILKYYRFRWECELDNWFLKERFGLADYRLQPLAAILNWHVLVFAAYAFVQYRRAAPLLTEPQAVLAPLGEVLAEHRQCHAQQTVREIAARARQGYSDDQIIAEFFPS
jgi:hypothetical protein